jgi:hypothetical protein
VNSKKSTEWRQPVELEGDQASSFKARFRQRLVMTRMMTPILFAITPVWKAGRSSFKNLIGVMPVDLVDQRTPDTVLANI